MREYTDMEAMRCRIVTKGANNGCMENAGFMKLVCFSFLSLIAR